MNTMPQNAPANRPHNTPIPMVFLGPEGASKKEAEISKRHAITHQQILHFCIIAFAPIGNRYASTPESTHIR
jgi:hypothetical protein